MTERPILFSGPMVRALLAGTKTQTRRVAKPVRHPDLGNWYTPGAMVLEHEPQHVIARACPYGQPGDRLWVRETWNRFDPWKGFSYAADHEGFGIGPDDDPDHVPEHSVRWKPSIHMPRVASRITLEITGVRVERLQDISQEDAKAEGAWGPDDSIVSSVAQHFGVSPLAVHPALAFRALWESINGPESWDANPWLWVVEFQRINAAAERKAA